MKQQSINNIIHIGLGKTATTAMQASLFPILASSLGLQYNPPEILKSVKLLRSLSFAPDDYHSLELKIKNSKPFFLSVESLAGWDPDYWESYASRNLKIFGPENTILITIKHPCKYLRSVYQKAVLDGYTGRPIEFFVNGEEAKRIKGYKREFILEFFNLDAFFVPALVNMYTDRFEKVIILPDFAVNDSSFYQSEFGLDKQQAEKVVFSWIKTKKLNVSPNAGVMSLLMIYHRFFGIFGANSFARKLRFGREFVSNKHGVSVGRKTFIFNDYLVVKRFLKALDVVLAFCGPYRLPDVQIFHNDVLKKNIAFYEELGKSHDH